MDERAMTSEESLKQLLHLGLPPKLDQVSECPLEKDYFNAFRSQADQCLRTVDKLQIGSAPVAQWPIAALLFAYEHPNAPYASAEARKISLKLLPTLKLTKDVVEQVFEFIKPRLTRDNWKFYMGERYILISVCQRFPCPEAHLPPALNICDSHLSQNKFVGAQCVLYLSKVFSHDDDRGGRADVIVDTLLKLSNAHDDLKVLPLVYEALEQLLLKTGSCHRRRSEVYLHLLRQCALAISIEEKILLGQILIRFLDGMDHAAGEFTQMTLEIAEFWADAPATRVSAMSLLQSALSCGAVSVSWERVARILLNSAVRCTRNNKNEIQAILHCRSTLSEIRTYPESTEEIAIFDLLQ